MRRHLLVTNDFPPKVGGIQTYLWELWRRLPPDDVFVMTTPYEGAAEWDASQDFTVRRVKERWLIPRPGLAARIDDYADEVGAEIVLLDPALPLGWVGPSLRHPYGVVLHGAEVTVPGRLPVARQALARVLRGAELVVSAGGYAAAEAERAARSTLPVVNVPPGVDVDRFVPLDPDARLAARRTFGVGVDDRVVVAVSRLVPRKGFDVVIEACGRLSSEYPDLTLLIGGTGRDSKRLERVARKSGAKVRFLGRFAENDKAALYGLGDVFAMLCRVRWGGLEQEGFGIVFVEAAAAGVPQLAGRSGGAAEAVEHGVTGLIVEEPTSVDAVVDDLRTLLNDSPTRSAMSSASVARAGEFSYEVLAARLRDALS